MRVLLAGAASGALALAAPAAAQDPLPPEERAAPMGEERLDALAERLADPDTQEQLSATLATLSDVLLDLPLAPMAEAVAEAAGEDPEAVDPDVTLRSMAPGAGEVPRVIEDRLPEAMDRMAGMSGALAKMLPALRDLADRFEAAGRELNARR